MYIQVHIICAGLMVNAYVMPYMHTHTDLL